MPSFHCERAWVGRLAERVLLEVGADGALLSVTEGAQAPAGALSLRGLTLPGFVNAHSHAFQRALRGRAQRKAGDFWAWRERMYEVAAALTPKSYFELARSVYAEMALAGVTSVFEFHYLHHDQGGRPYANPNAMGEALLAAASEAGIRITLVDVCYLQGGLDGRPLEGPQLRFGDGDAGRWAERVSLLRGSVGAAVHSVRAVPAEAMDTVRDWAAARGAPLHFHLSERQEENAECRDRLGMSPTALLDSRGLLGERSVAVHAIHISKDDRARLRATAVCACPTTERDLGDGVAAFTGARLLFGSDSHALIDLLEEARAFELDQRLFTGHRGLHSPEELLAGLTGGAELKPGAPADFVSLRLDSPRTTGALEGDLLAHVIFAAGAADVTDVVVGGRQVVAEGRHPLCG